MSNNLYYLPAEFHDLFEDLAQANGLEYSVGPTAELEELPPSTTFETIDEGLRVIDYGADFFSRLAVDRETLVLELPLRANFTERACRLVRALGFSLDSFEPPLERLRLRRYSGKPATDDTLSGRVKFADYETTQRIAGEYRQRLSEVVHPVAPAGSGTLEEVRKTWYERASELKPEDVFLWGERYWRFRLLGAVTPIFLTGTQTMKWREASERVLRSIHQAVEKLQSDPQLRTHILGSEAPITTDFPLIARFDGSMQPGGPSFFELNVGAIGFSDTDRMSALYASLGLSKDLPTRVVSIFPHLLKALQGLYQGEGTPTVAIPVAQAEEPKYAPGLLAYVNLIHAAGWEATFTPLRSLTYSAGVLRDEKGRKVDLIARAYFPGSQGTEHVEEAISDGAVRLVNPPAAHGNKGVFEMLDDPCVPWTRIVTEGESKGPSGDTVRVLDYALANKDSLVLKPSDGFGGRDVLLGNKTEKDAWESALRQAVIEYPQGRRSVVQVCTAMPSDSFYDRNCRFGEMYWDLNAFVFDGKFSGLAARLSASTLTNISLGGGAVPIYEV